MHARMTLIGMENILNRTEDVARSLKDAWEIENTQFDGETLLSTIMVKGGQMEPLFTDPRFYYTMTAQWWKKWYPTFSYWWIALEKEYEPLWDRNGFEEIEDHTDETGTLDTATSGKEIMDDDTTGSRSSTEIMDDDTTYSNESEAESSTENRVSAFDASTYQPHDHSSTDSSSSESGSGTDDRTTTYTEQTKGTDDRTTTTSGTVDTDTTGSKDYAHSMHSWGNWGISQTSQKLLDSEFDVRFRLNPYDLMSDIFLNEMAVRVF